MNPIDLTGKRFGRLIAVSFSESRGKIGKRKRRYWLCDCDCGKESIANSNSLTTGTIRSCGCLKKEIASRNAKKWNEERPILPKGVSAARAVYGTYKKAAKDFERTFDVSFDEFISISQMDCFYCGKKPKNKQTSGRTNGRTSSFFYNGMDRKDNTVGYLKTNIVPCCRTCNQAKLKMSVDEFEDWIRSVYHHFCIGKHVEAFSD